MATPALRRPMLRAVLSLPIPILRALSGGGVVYRNGRTLDPRLQFIAEAARRYPPLSALPPAEARRLAAEELELVKATRPAGVAVEDRVAPGPGGQRKVRLYRPRNQDPAVPLLVFAHQGGGVLGDLETDDAFCALLAADCRCPVLSVDYRLAPEDRFPAGFEDMLAAYRWARDNAAHIGAPAGRAMIGGASMGGGFAAAVCHRLKRDGDPQPELQLLVYPAVDLAAEPPSAAQGDAPFLAGDIMAWFLAQYVGADLSPADPALSPLREPDMTGLAPALVAVAGFDPLLDQGQVYARRLMDAGVPVTFRCYDSLCHGFTAFAGAVPAAQAACEQLAGLVRQAARKVDIPPTFP